MEHTIKRRHKTICHASVGGQRGENVIFLDRARLPTSPPQLRQKTQRPSSNWDRRKSRHERGCGRAHEAMRRIVLDEEPLCRACLGK